MIEEIVTPTGTFVAVKFANGTAHVLSQFITDNNIPSPEKAEDLHTTVVYSRKTLPDDAFEESIHPQIATVVGYDKLGPTNESLVMLIKCDWLTERHNKLVKEYGATHDFESYIPHITLSNTAGDFDIKLLPKYKDPLIITSEYTEPLDPEFGE